MSSAMLLYVLLGFLSLIFAGPTLGDSDFAQLDGAPPSKIAVVGAGIGGTATAHFLRQHFGPEVRIDVFEKQEVGGRLATVTVNNQPYETGGSIIHALNLHMQDFMKQLGLKYRKSVAGKMAVFNGKEFILEETDWYLLDLFRLWWRYGISFIRLQMWVEEIMEKFMRIYKYQAHGYAFSTVEELLNSLGGSGFLNMTRRSLSESLLELGVSQRFIDEVVAPIMWVNYGQNVSMPAFVVLTHPGMDSTRPLNVCCGILHQDVSSKLRGGASMERTGLSSTSHRCSIGLRSGEFGGQVNTSNSLLCFSNHS